MIAKILYLVFFKQLIPKVVKEEGSDGTDGDVLCRILESGHLFYKPRNGFLSLRCRQASLLKESIDPFGENILQEIICFVFMGSYMILTFADHDRQISYCFLRFSDKDPA